MLINSQSAFPGGGQSTPMGSGSLERLVDDDVEIVTTQLVAEPEAVRELLAILSSDERQRAGRFAFDLDRRRFIVARGRLRQLLATRLGVRPELVEFTYGAHGKPATARRFAGSNLRFNLSHCGDLAVYAFASGRDIGVDVEAIRPLPDADAIATRFFSRRENEAYRALCPCDRPLAFFTCWTRKEAFIKAIGDGLSYPLYRVNVSLALGHAPTMVRLDDTPEDQRRWRLQSFFPAAGFVAAVVTGNRTAEKRFAA
jgi:4'-phosphopantetheinyl transferase